MGKALTSLTFASWAIAIVLSVSAFWVSWAIPVALVALSLSLTMLWLAFGYVLHRAEETGMI